MEEAYTKKDGFTYRNYIEPVSNGGFISYFKCRESDVKYHCSNLFETAEEARKDSHSRMKKNELVDIFRVLHTDFRRNEPEYIVVMSGVRKFYKEDNYTDYRATASSRTYTYNVKDEIEIGNLDFVKKCSLLDAFKLREEIPRVDFKLV